MKSRLNSLSSQEETSTPFGTGVHTDLVLLSQANRTVRVSTCVFLDVDGKVGGRRAPGHQSAGLAIQGLGTYLFRARGWWLGGEHSATQLCQL